ncbi:MAG: hypothetical protein V4621_02635 [Pseudomonadota bacterium]
MRLTKRKKRILDTLNQVSPVSVCLLNELRVKCMWAGEFKQAKSRKSDQRKSFNRTVLGNFDGLHTLHLSDGRGFYTNLSVGLFARWAIWELIDQGYLTHLPAPDEIQIVVGRDACSAFVKLKHDQFAVIGTAVFMSDITLVGSRSIEENDLKAVAKIPYPISGIKKDTIDNHATLSVSELVSLPSAISLNGKIYVSTAKKKFGKY